MPFKLTYKLSFLAFFSLIFNLIWEFSHSRLYVGFDRFGQNWPILVRVSIGDMFLISFFTLFLLFLTKNSNWQRNLTKLELVLHFAGLIFLSSTWEKVSVMLQRWSYKPIMPLVPILNISLLVFFQLAITGTLALVIAEHLGKKV